MWKLPFAVLLLFSAGCPAFMGNDVLFKCSGLFKDDPSIGQLVEGNWCGGAQDAESPAHGARTAAHP